MRNHRHPHLRLPAALGAGLVLSFGAVAPSAVLTGPAVAVPASSAASPTDPNRHLPAGWKARSNAVAAKVGIDVPAEQAVARAIDPDDHQCGPTAFTAYIGRLLEGLDQAELLFLLGSGVLSFPTYDALFFGREGDPRYTPREEAHTLRKTFRDARRFWDIDSSDIQLLAMNGGVLQDRDRLVRLLTEVFALPRTEAVDYAAFVVRTVAAIPELQDGRNPIFTLNAFAFTAEGQAAPFDRVPDKIVFGEGMIDALQAMGIGDVGPEAVLAHEFAHHVQFEKDLFDSPLVGAEATRRTELMADAMATYFLTHKRGLALNTKRVLQAQRTFFEVGDCAFADPGHHGTPLQRRLAAEWGAELAARQQKQGHVLPALVVARQFERVLPELVAPDAG